MRRQLGDTLITALGKPEQRAQLGHARIPNTVRLMQIKKLSQSHILSKVTELALNPVV